MSISCHFLLANIFLRRLILCKCTEPKFSRFQRQRFLPTWRRRSEAGLTLCWKSILSIRFCCSKSKTLVFSFTHSSLRSYSTGKNRRIEEKCNETLENALWNRRLQKRKMSKIFKIAQINQKKRYYAISLIICSSKDNI